MRHKKLSARILSLVLTAAMVGTMMPSTVFATEGDIVLGASSLECHVEHDMDCGYVAAVEGTDCSHKNEDGTYSCASDTVSDNTATPGDADRTTCTHEDDCGYVEAVAGADCKHTCEKCEVKDSGAADKQTAYDKVVDLFTALPAASVINRTTTQEEKDAVIAQLTAAMDAFDALTADEQALFMKEQAALYKAAMALNDAITGAPPLTLTTGVIPPFVEGTNKRYKNGETFKLSELKAGDRIEVGAICNESNSDFNFDSYELFLTGGEGLESGPYGTLHVGGTPTAISDRYPNSNTRYKGDATHVTTRVEWILYDVDFHYFVSPDKTVQHEYDVTVNKNGLTGAAAKFEIELAEGNKLVEGDSFKVADYDTVLVTLTPNGGGSFKAAPTVTVDSGATAGTVTKVADSEVYTCEVTGFTANTTITVAGTAETGGGTTVNTWAELQTALTAGGDIKLTADITAGSSDVFLNVPANITVTLDLNGFTIDRGLKDATAILNGHVITINGDLTVKDTSTEGIGVITGAKNSGIGSSSGSSNIAGGIYVPLGGVFTLESGKISGNIASGNGGGVYNSGTFTMKGGEISANTSMRFSGGVSNSGTFTMEGGEISANTASSGGGGVMATSGTFIVGGTAVIDNNKSGNTGVENADNLLLYNSLIQQSTATPLATGASIGVTIMDSGKGAFTDENATWETHADKFFSDNTAYKVRYDVGTKKLELVEGPSITVATQNGTATYGTAANPTFAVTTANFGGGGYPNFAPSVVWTNGSAPTGVTPVFTESNAKLTMTTTTATPAGEYKFKVVSPEASPETGNYESAEATLKVDKLEATITWGTTTSFPYNGSAQAPTATVSNKVGSDAVTVTVTGGQTNVGTGITATADALAGAAAGNYAMPSSKPTQTFAITTKTVTVTDGTLEVKKAYDGNTTAGTATGALALTGVVSGDAVNVSVKVDTVGTYADANVGKNKTVTLTISLDGTAKGNYALGSASYSFTKAEITKTAYTGTSASAPDSTPENKGDKSITIKPVTPPVGEGVEYAVSKTNTPPTSDRDWQTSTTFDNLDPNTTYYFFARVKENDNHAPGGESAGTSITTDKSEYTTKPTKPDGTPDSKSDTSITLKTVTPPDGETLQYGIDKDNNGTITWQDGPTFSPLSPNTEYKFYTRVKENDKHKAGPESDTTAIKTAKAPYTGTDAVATTLANKTDTSVTLVPQTIANETVEYGIKNADGTIKWQDGNTFTGLTANTDYYFFARVKENDTHAAGATSASTTFKTDKVAYTGTQTTAPTATKTHNTVTLNTQAIDGETVQYGIKQPDGTIIWQDSSTFSGLTPDTEYTFYTRVKENDTHKAGTTSDATTVKTMVAPAKVSGNVKDGDGNIIVGAIITLTPSDPAITTTTDASGNYIFNNVPAGKYNIEVKNGSRTITNPITVAGTDITKDMQFPSGDRNTVVESTPNTPDVVVDGLNDLLTNPTVGNGGWTQPEVDAITGGGSVELKFTADVKAAGDVTADKGKIEAIATGKKIDLLLDLSVLKTVKDSGGAIITNGTKITTLADLIEVYLPIPADLQGKAGLALYRVHNGTAQALGTSPDGNGEYYTIDPSGEFMTLYVKNFSTYALGYNAFTVTISGGGSGATGAGNYSNGDTVNLYAGTKSNYSFDGWTTTSAGVVFANASSDTTSFTMPGNAVEVKANWKSNGGGDDGGSGSGSGGGSSYTYYYIKATAGPGGSMSTPERVKVRAGESAGFTITPDKGYQIEDVLVNGKSIGAKSYYAFTNVHSDQTIHATFKKVGHDNPQTGVNFDDVQTSDWFYDAVMEATANGWFNGTSDTTFSPYAPTSRGMIATILHRIANTPGSAAASFTDVASDAYYANGVAWAQEHGIVTGYGNGNYGPNNNITREQLASILYRYASYKGYDVSKTAALGNFADASGVSGYAKDAMSWAVGSGLISGRGNNTLAPTATATRAEVAVILVRFEELFVK